MINMYVLKKSSPLPALLIAACCSLAACSTQPQPPTPKSEAPTVEAEPTRAPEADETEPEAELAPTQADSDPPSKGEPPAQDPPHDPGEEPKAEEPKAEDSKAEDPKGDKTVTRSRQTLRVSHMLDRLEIREVFKFDGTLADAPFEGQTSSAIYNAHRLQPADGKSLGFALQFWKLPSSTRALEQFEELFSQSVGGVKTKDAGDRSFRVEHHKLRSLVFLDQRHQAIAWLTCDEKLCSFEQLTLFAQRVRKRF